MISVLCYLSECTVQGHGNFSVEYPAPAQIAA